MPSDYSRIHRLLKILTLIQGGRGWTSKRLADECGVTERTIYRDLRDIQGAGIPYSFNPDGGRPGYAVGKDFFLPPVQLTLEESLALAALAEHAGAREQVPYTRAAGKAIVKIRSVLPAGLKQELDKVEQHIQIRLAASSPPEAAQDVYDRVRQALADQRPLLCTYESLNKREASRSSREFRFEPYALFFSQRAWYAVGKHFGHNEVRCLKLSRFSKIIPLEGKYAIPRSFTLESHLGNAWRMIRGKDSYDVELVFDAEFGETISDTLWHHTQDIEENSDGSIIFRCKVDGLDEIVWWVLSMGPHCVVKKPKPLRDRVKDLAAAMVKNYGPT